MSYELPCAHCCVLTRADCLVDISELIALGGLVCETCEHELVAELHDDDACACRSCERARSRADQIRREAEARVRGGLSSRGMELLGWAKGEVSMKTEDVLLIETMTQFEGLSAALKHFIEGGEPSAERAKAALEVMRQHLEEAADALQTLELLEAGRTLGVAL